MSKSRPWEISRRHMLRGIGATMALPFLEAMVPPGRSFAAAGAAGPDGQPLRFAAFFMPNGVNHEHWKLPAGRISELTRTLMPLEALKNDINIINGLNANNGGHTRGTATFLTAQGAAKTSKVAGVNVGGPSIDQFIGQELPGAKLPSLELGMSSPRHGNDGNGDTNVYTSFVSWSDATTPVPHEMNPLRAFNRLFRGARTTGSTSNLAPRGSFTPDKRVIDAVLEDAKSLKKRVGRADQQKLDQYLSAVRDVEDRILGNNETNQGLFINGDVMKDIRAVRRRLRTAMDRPRKDDIIAAPNVPYREYGQMMMDVMALALWSNSTRATTLMFGDGGHGRNMSFIEGVSGSHHSIAHHGSKSEQLEMYTRINTFFVEQYAYFINKLKGMREYSSNVLENSLVYFGSNMTDGQNHGGANMPIVLAGNGGGRINTGRVINTSGRTGQLHRTVLNTMGLDASKFGGSGTVSL